MKTTSREGSGAVKPGSTSGSPWRYILTGILCVIPVWLILVEKASHYELDDALIYFRYVRNFLEHGELTYNLGHRWHGITSPLFTLVSICLSWITGRTILAVNIFCGISLLGAAAGMQYYAARETGMNLAGYLAMALIVCSPFFYCCFGLESTLVLFMMILAIIIYMKENYRLLSCILGLLLITRIDTGIFIIAVVLELLRQNGWKWMRQRLVLAVPILAPLIVVSVLTNLYYANSSLHTMLAKAGQGLSGYWGAWPRSFINIRSHAKLFWGNHIWLYLPVALLAVIGAVQAPRSRANRLIITYILLYGGIFAVFNSPPYHWYYAPLYFFGLAYAGAALSRMIHRSFSIGNRFRRTAAGSASILITALLVVSIGVVAYRTTSRLGGPGTTIPPRFS